MNDWKLLARLWRTAELQRLQVMTERLQNVVSLEGIGLKHLPIGFNSLLHDLPNCISSSFEDHTHYQIARMEPLALN